MSTTPTRRVLSIQSHVVSGHVGNKAATFPLQLLGFDVDALNTVQFSNHTGYPTFTGKRMEPQDLRDLYDGLVANELTGYSHVLVGYIGRPDSLQVLSDIISDLRRRNPSIRVVIDPVMGDDGSYYVPQEALPLYRDVLCPQADVLLPNQFEAEELTGLSVGTVEEAVEAVKALHALGPGTVVLTSLRFSSDAGYLSILGSDADGVCKIRFPLLEGWFTGSGDLFAALLMARLEEAGRDGTPKGRVLLTACERALGSVHGVLLRTQEKARGGGALAARRGDPPATVRACELAVIAGRAEIEVPIITYRGEML